MKFNIGKLYMTAAIAEALKDNTQFSIEIHAALYRYSNCDWGDMSGEDKRINDSALKDGDRIFAAYKTSKGKIWIITEADRSCTTILFPSDY